MKIQINIFKLLISLTLSIPFLIIVTPQANADQCLSQFPDSAWSAGEPKGVQPLLSNNLVRTKRMVIRIADQKQLPSSLPTFGIKDITSEYLNNSRVEYVSKLNYIETKYPVKVVFEYQGSNCSTRTIEVNGGAITYKPFPQVEFSRTEEVKNFFTNYYNEDFLNIQKKVDAVTELSRLLNASEKNPIKISSNNLTEDSTFAWWLGLEKSLYPVIGYPSLNVISEDECLTTSFAKTEKLYLDSYNKMSDIDKSFYQRSLMGFFDKIEFAQGKKVCKLRVASNMPGSYKNYLNKTVPVQLFGYVWVENNLSSSAQSNPKQESKPNKTIICTKGKLSKKITGLNPKCPSGYALKK